MVYLPDKSLSYITYLCYISSQAQHLKSGVAHPRVPTVRPEEVAMSKKSWCGKQVGWIEQRHYVYIQHQDLQNPHGSVDKPD
eukprot:1146495-Pelagomonas_calceolata.AAC.3